MRLPGGRQAQVVRAHDRGEPGAQAPPEAERITRIPYQSSGRLIAVVPRTRSAMLWR